MSLTEKKIIKECSDYGIINLRKLEKIEEYCLKNDLPLIFGYLDEQRVALLQKRYFLTKNRFDRDWCDYIYLKENF